jgi:hypothetical protein
MLDVEDKGAAQQGMVNFAKEQGAPWSFLLKSKELNREANGVFKTTLDHSNFVRHINRIY